MRRLAALLALAALAGCVVPTGSTVDVCDGTWREVESVIVTPSTAEGRVIPMTCIRQVDDKRIRIGFSMPPGPTCYVLSAVRVEESADAVSVAIVVAANDDPTAGACPDDPGRTATEVDLQAPIADRTLLDAAVP
jgi:hypothetical protein